MVRDATEIFYHFDQIVHASSRAQWITKARYPPIKETNLTVRNFREFCELTSHSQKKSHEILLAVS